jgi:thiol-disulfide isomerase/thioredoxin
MTPPPIWRAAAAMAGVILVIGGLASCHSSASSSAKPGTCLAPLAVAKAASPAPDPAAPSAGAKLPNIALGCLDGSGSVKLSAIDRPMVISMWASYCEPCQAESPHVESFFRATGDTVAVIGVDTADISSKGKSFVSSFGLTYPMVTDPDQLLFTALELPKDLPTMLFVTADGQLAGSYASNQLDGATLRRLTAKYLGVQVS